MEFGCKIYTSQPVSFDPTNGDSSREWPDPISQLEEAFKEVT